MMKKWWLLLIALFLLSTGLVISGIRQSQKQAPTALPENAERIVSLAPSLTEILFALGLGDKITGVTLNCDYPPEALQKPKVGSYWQPDTEAVIAAKPDLVITLRIPQHENIANSLKGLGYRVLVLKIEKIKELPIAIREIGITTGSEQNAEKLIENISNKLEHL
ncbi:MAG: helical backbone metal receptor, partial [Phycisphaerales bacterium]